MQANVIIKNIVLIGLFNPSSFDKYFFIKNDIAKESEILNNSSFNALGAIQLVTKEFNILVSLNQIIITDLIPTNNSDKISQIISSIIKLQNLVSITALGINFHWILTDDSKSFSQLSRDLFYRDNIDILSNSFNTDDSMFGIYASKLFKDSRLKLDVKPSNVQTLNAPQTVPLTNISGMVFGFNFHFDIKNKTNIEEILGYITEYLIYKEESKNLISIYL